MRRTIFFFLFISLFTVIYAQPDDAMTLVFNAASAGDQASLPLSGTVNVEVDWGDGSTASVTTAGILKHSYSTEGEYTITITGELTHFGDPNVSMRGFTDVVSWGSLGLTSLSSAFKEAYELESVPDSLPGNVTDVSYMFEQALFFDDDLSTWDVSNVTDMSYMFSYAQYLASDFSRWDVSNVTNMKGMFFYSGAPDKNIGGWDVSNVTDMNSMFSNAYLFNDNLGSWDVSNVTDMAYMFNHTEKFRGYDIGDWDVSGVIDMHGMFSSTMDFSTDLSKWDVSNVVDMSEMFDHALNFNGDINDWDVSNVTNMSNMFETATGFNRDLNNWDVSNVTNMSNMFETAIKFNGDISGWDVSNVTNMEEMFYNARAFTGDLSSWNISNVIKMNSMLERVTLPTESYSNMLIEWSKLSLQSNVSFSGGNSTFNTAGGEARQKIITDFDWKITDGGFANMLTYFNAADIGDSTVVLSWGLPGEGTGYEFEIQRALELLQNESNWFVVDTIPGNSAKDYAFVDKYPLVDCDCEISSLVYRLKLNYENIASVYSDTLTLVLTDIEDGGSSVPVEFNLSQNYPNPFNPVTTIKYSVAENSNVNIKVYNILGQEVITLVNEVKSPGTYNVKMDGSNLASGVYIYRMTAGHFSSVKKFVLMK